MKPKITVLIFLTICLSAVSGMAQQHQDRARLEAAIERTDEIISRAGEAVRESGSERARNQLEMAARLQHMAKVIAMDNAIFDNEMALRAGKYTLSAREKARRAIAITRQAEENEDYVRRRLEKTDDLIKRIEEKVGDDAPRGLRTILDTAREKQMRAVEFFRNRRLKNALQLTLQVEKSLKEAAERVSGYRKAQKRFAAQQNRYFSILERIELSGYGDRPQIRQTVEKAERLRIRADEMVSTDGRYDQAEKTMQQAIEVLARIAEEYREPMKIKAALEDMGTMAEHLQDQVDRFGDREIKRQYQNALEHLNKARHMFNQGDFEGSAAQLQAGRQIMVRISKIVEKPVLVEHGLEMLQAMVERLEEKVTASDDELLKKEFARAREQLTGVSALHQAGDYRAAAAQLEVVERMLARIADSLGG
jgi:hypothetical protein